MLTESNTRRNEGFCRLRIKIYILQMLFLECKGFDFTYIQLKRFCYIVLANSGEFLGEYSSLGNMFNTEWN